MHVMAAVPAILLALAVFPASAAWHAANPAVVAAVKNPRIAAALDATVRMDKAILGHDVDGFGDIFTDDAVVNNPFNKIAGKADAINNLRTRMIDYTTLDR